MVEKCNVWEKLATKTGKKTSAYDIVKSFTENTLGKFSKQNGYKIGITKIREVAGTDKQGTNAYGVIKAAKHLGFSAKGVKGNKESFFSEFPLPCIAVECPSKNGVSFN